MGDRITNEVNSVLLRLPISLLLIFAIYIHSGANVFTELPDSSVLFHVWK